MQTPNQRRRRHSKSFLLALSAATAVLLTGCGSRFVVLHPAGPVGREELHLIELSAILVLAIITPVFLFMVYVLIRYRDKPGNKAPYQPKWSENRTMELIWWGIPIVIVAVLGGFTAKTTFALVHPPEKSVKPITIQVTSLDWKWLFQYPGQQVATVNYADIPTGVPVRFQLTANGPMNSFWVPQLGGQEYTMPGMSMGLWLQADKAGTYYGHGANFTGKGFAHMYFHVVAKSQTQFNQWVKKIKATSPRLTQSAYKQLTDPSVVGTKSYSGFPPNLYKDVVSKEGGKYMNHMMKAAGLNH
ncbi:cytochrome c oxidase subunit II [Alicyclobacillus sp. SO9]|uniref:cytochrome c oxidase subunit II n=1 Tax=Alicyclobacillus sp. SO9 TaxID=2665646 RepID=UPI001E2E2BD7|nr:cytochrome c oxidase subunit II [Alicyclobacillus sp. SO9]